MCFVEKMISEKEKNLDPKARIHSESHLVLVQNLTPGQVKYKIFSITL